MGDGKVNARKLVIKEGMTPQDVKNNPKATPQQKAFACVFDSDGVEGYSAREAEVFNSTTISCKGEKGITLWTQYQDGTKKGTTVSGDIASFKYAPQGDVKPFTKKVVVKKHNQKESEEINAAKLIDKFIAEGKGELKVETYENGQVKSKEYYDKETYKRIKVSYYEDGTVQSEKVNEWDGWHLHDTKKVEYYPNGKVKSSYTYDMKTYKRVNKEFYEDGTIQSNKVNEWDGLNLHDTKKVEYYPNGKIKSSYTYDMETYKKVNKEFYEDGTPKSLIEECWHEVSAFSLTGSSRYIKTTEIYYDENGNVIDKAKVTK